MRMTITSMLSEMFNSFHRFPTKGTDSDDQLCSTSGQAMRRSFISQGIKNSSD